MSTLPTPKHPPAASNQLMGPGMKIAMLVAGFLFAVFGLLTIQFAYAITTASLPWATSLTLAIVQYPAGTEAGLIGLEQAHEQYRALASTMSTHTLTGGLVVSLGILQFIPALRRKYRNLHRASGALLAVLMVAVSVTSLHFLAVIPPTHILAGQSFYITLLALSGLSLVFLMQAGLSALSKDFRSHMVWMGLAFCCFLTAPLLRYNYILVGAFDPQNINRLVQNSVPSVLIQGYLLFMLWLCIVGDKDIPNKSGQSTLAIPTKWLTILAMLSALSVLLLAGLHPTIVEPNFFTETSTRPAWLLAIGVALLKCVQIFSSKEVWLRGLQGQKPGQVFTASTMASALGLLWFASQIDTAAFHAHTVYYGLVNFAVIELIALALAHLTSPLKNGTHLFALANASLAWCWLGIPGTVLAISAFGFSWAVALTTAFVLVPPTFMVIGIIIASGISLYLAPKKRGTSPVG